jgi:hypothetical protein
MLALLRPAVQVTSSKVAVTTASHEKSLDQLAPAVTAIVASTAVLVISFLSVACTLF